jgi:hypothetical protein
VLCLDIIKLSHCVHLILRLENGKGLAGKTPKFAVDNPWHIGLFSLMSGGSCGCGHWGLLCDFLEASIVLFFINIIGF